MDSNISVLHLQYYESFTKKLFFTEPTVLEGQLTYMGDKKKLKIIM